MRTEVNRWRKSRIRYAKDKVLDIKIAYTGGGSRGWAWTLMTDLALEKQLSGTINLYDIDSKAVKNNEITESLISKREDALGEWNYRTGTSLEDALTNCDFVVISILSGTFDEMESDVHLPERLGIYQPVGDTAGPGGIIRGLRTIPMFAEIAEAIKAYSLETWVISYTDPMSPCVKTLYHVFPEIKALGCCHEVFGAQKVLREICEACCDEKNIDWHDICVNVLGINHFTWFSSASYKGTDLFPIYDAYIAEHFKGGYHDPDRNWMNSLFNCAHRVKFDLFKRYGLIVAAGGRHLVEFMPGNEYLNDPDTVKKWRFGLTTVNWGKEDLKRRLERSRRLADNEEAVELKPIKEEGILLIKALCGLGRLVGNVNIPNTYEQIPNLSRDAVVETNAVFERDAIRPMIAGDIPENIKELILLHLGNREYTLQAASKYDEGLVVKVFLNDPLVKGKGCTEEDVKILAHDMVQNTLKHLPGNWK